MTIEKLITDLTDAVKANTAALLGAKPTATSGRASSADTTAAAAAAPKADAPPAEAALDYNKVKAAAIALANKKGRAAVDSVMGALGVTNMQQCKPEQYAHALKLLTEAAA